MTFGHEFCNNWDNIKNEYERISKDWYQNLNGYEKAKLIKKDELSSKSDGYDNKLNEIWITAPAKEHSDELERSVFSRLELIVGINKENNSENQKISWPQWKRVIVHESIHEYEKKVIKDCITDIGRELHQKYIGRFCYPELHDERFFTAAADRSSYFLLTPDALIASI